MFYLFIFVLCLASSAVLTSVVIEEPQDICSELEFRCRDGNCVDLSSFCDGRRDCDDGTDEETCYSGISSTGFGRVKRQARKKCSKYQWQCRDGSCIRFDGKCDGVKDCADGSDETFPLCRHSRCQSNWFRCAYGACVDGTAACNGLQECADNSDELLPSCRNEPTEVRGQFKCENGEVIAAALHCDGSADCSDGSDESIRACAGKICPEYLFQCAYGACVDRGSDCNGISECYDGSDESDELCNRTSAVTQTPPVPTSKPGEGCVLPSYPAHGRYVVQGIANAAPGQAYSTVVLNVTCNPGYDVPGVKESIFCFDGIWSGEIVDCVRFCRLNKDASVEYRCLLSGAAEGSRECNLYEPDGTMVRPECRSPDYYFSGVLNYMRCIDGSWDYIARCVPGLTKNGTNITILIKDEQYEVHVGTFQYSVPKPGATSNKPNSGIIANKDEISDKNNANNYIPNTSGTSGSNYNSGTTGNNYKNPNSNSGTTGNNYNIPNSNRGTAGNIYKNPNSNSGTTGNNYKNPNSNSGNSGNNYNTPVTVTPTPLEQFTPVTPDDSDYNIDEDDWRMLPNLIRKEQNSKPVEASAFSYTGLRKNSNTFTFGSKNRKNSLKSDLTDKKPDVSVNIENGQVVVKTKDGIDFNYDKDRIVFRD